MSPGAPSRSLERASQGLPHLAQAQRGPHRLSARAGLVAPPRRRAREACYDASCCALRTGSIERAEIKSVEAHPRIAPANQGEALLIEVDTGQLARIEGQPARRVEDD